MGSFYLGFGLIGKNKLPLDTFVFDLSHIRTLLLLHNWVSIVWVRLALIIKWIKKPTLIRGSGIQIYISFLTLPNKMYAFKKWMLPKRF